MNKEYLADLKIDKTFISFLDEMNSPIIISDTNLNIIWYNSAYKEYQNNLPDLSKLKKEIL